MNSSWRKLLPAAKQKLLNRLRERRAPPEFLLDWGKRFLPRYFSQGPSRMHRAVAGKLIGLRRGSHFNLLAPRSAAKSTLANTTFATYCAVTEREPFIVLIAENDVKATSDLRKIQAELAGNALLAQAYPDACGKTAVWNQHELHLRNGVAIQAFGSGNEGIRGIKHGAQRPTLVICDDLQGRDHAHSALKRERLWDWFTRDVLNLGGEETIYVNLGTAVHRDGLVNRLTNNSPGWESMSFKSIEQWPSRMQLWKEWEGILFDYSIPTADERSTRAAAFYGANKPDMECGAVLDWPERESLLSLMERRLTIGYAAFESEKQGNPIDPEKLIFPEEYFDEHVWFDQWPVDAMLTIRAIGIDPSRGAQDKPGDYSAIVKVGVAANGLIYVEADLARRPSPQIVSDAVDAYRNFRADILGIESDQFQMLFAPMIEQELKRRQVVQFWIQPIETRGDSKTFRINRLTGPLHQNRLRFKRNSPSTRLLVEQLRDYPTADHDDGPDGLEIAIQAAAMVQRGAAADVAQAKEEYLEC